MTEKYLLSAQDGEEGDKFPTPGGASPPVPHAGLQRVRGTLSSFGHDGRAGGQPPEVVAQGSILRGLVEHGFAQVMTVPPNVKHEGLFLKLQREAREARRGLWR